MRKFFHQNGLSIVMLGLFFVSLVGQSVTGYTHFNDEQREQGHAALTYLQYLGSGQFIETVFENWESEFLQMALFVILTSVLYQKGSAESKSLKEHNDVDEDPEGSQGKQGVPGPVSKGGLLLKIYKHSLSLSLLLLFAISFVLHAVGGAQEFREEQADKGIQVAMTALQYMGTSKFWFESFQNWQSEFLSVGAIVVLSIFLRQHGSSQSKPVAAPHDEEGG